MATKGKKATPLKKTAKKAKTAKPTRAKPRSKPKRAATPRAAPAAAAPLVDETAKRELDAARTEVTRLVGELKLALADRDRTRADHAHATAHTQGQQAELDKLRAETLKSSVDLSAATRRADDAGRRADEAGRRSDERERERARLAGELAAAHAELGGYKLRCPKCGKNFVEEEYEGITIDRCSGCDAVYFDAGEVDQLIVAVHDKTAGPTADPQATSGWFRKLFKKKPKGEPTGGDAPPAA